MAGPMLKGSIGGAEFGLSPELAAILEASGVGVYSFDAAAYKFEVDATCRRLFDIGPDVVLSPDVMVQKIHPADLERYWKAAADSMQTGIFDCDYRVQCADGSTRFISGRGRLRSVTPGAPPIMLGVCIDVTARRALEEELVATQLRMQNLADGVPGLFSYVDRRYIIRFLSAQYDQWLGHPRERHLHQHIAELIGPDTFVRRKPLYDRCLAGEVVTYDDKRTMANGEERWYSITYQPARAESGEILGLLSLGVDMTERRRMEQALEDKSKELERSNRDLEQFAYVASHDLKAPLRAIEILVDWLREDLTDVDKGDVQGNLGLLKQRTGRLHRLLDDLLAYSRAGRDLGGVADVDVGLMVRDLATLLAPPATMRVEDAPGLPIFRGRPAALEQVLRNLINNAIKHHPTQSGYVRVSAWETADEVLFSVEDDGAGIPQEFAEKVFKMFQTLKPRDEVEGSGMGLAICKRIVESQGGRIWFEPGPGGKGTVFKFNWKKLPREGADPAEDNHDRGDQHREYLAG